MTKVVMGRGKSGFSPRGMNIRNASISPNWEDKRNAYMNKLCEMLLEKRNLNL